MPDLNNPETPYSNLEPGLILDAVESLGFSCTGSLLALNSYENRVYQVGLEDSSFLIAKFYRPHRWTNDAINEEHQFALELSQQDIPVVPPLCIANKTLHEHEGYRFALFNRQGGRALELDNMDQLEWMGRFIGRLHAVGAVKPFKHRLQLNVQEYGYKPYTFLLDKHFIPDNFKQRYSGIVEPVLQKIDSIFQQAGPSLIRLHGDCHTGNVLWNDRGPQIVDLDDCLSGPAIQDLWMLLTGTTKSEINLQLDYILQGYETFRSFNYTELRLIEPLRTLRMIHYAAWLAKRWEDPAFHRNFPWFNTERYWEEHTQHLYDQALLLEEL